MRHKTDHQPYLWRTALRWGKRLALGALSLILALAVTGTSYQAMATAADKEQFPPPGNMVKVGDHQLHIYCLGAGSPTVIVDNGAGNWSVTWMHLQERLADETRFCVYDRAGLGWSEPGPLPRTSKQMVEELHILLNKANIQPPYILVGHSLGGYNVRIYADRYPDEVAGIVLVESGHEEQWTALPGQVNELIDEQVGLLKIASLMSRVGFLRFQPPQLAALSPDLQPAYTAAMVQPKTLNAMITEIESAPVSATQLMETGSLGDLPLAVVSARHSFNAFVDLPTKIKVPFEEADIAWMALQEQLVTLSTNSKHFISEIGTHDLNFDDPDLVIEAIRYILVVAK